MENDLERQFRELIEQGARPVSFHEVSQRGAPSASRAMGRARLSPSPQPGRPPLAARRDLPSRSPPPAFSHCHPWRLPQRIV